MKKTGYIYRPSSGRPTADYGSGVDPHYSAGAIFLAFVAVPSQAIITRGPTNLLYFGGTGILIMVGVALETMQQIEAHLLMRHYEGFLK